MQNRLLQKSLALITALIFTITAQGHSVDQIYMELFPEEQGFRALVYADAAYCLPEYRGDTGKEAPNRDWLLSRTESEHASLRKEAELFIRGALGFMQDEVGIDYAVNFPDYQNEPYEFHQSLLSKAILRIEIEGRYLPAGGSLQASWVDEFGANLLMYIMRPGAVEEEGSLLQIDWVEGGNKMDVGVQVYPFELGGEAKVEIEQKRSWLSFVKVGYQHIAGLDEKGGFKGLDHILFVIGLFLFSPTWRPLLHQSLAFTLAHSVTLALSLMGVLAFSGKWVEVLIALSIVYVAVENLWLKDELPKHRLGIIFGFGLLHGLGFGSVLQELLPSGKSLLPIVWFNLGVEIGQIVILAICFAAFWWFRDRFKWIRISGSVMIALLASYWVVERIMG